MNTTRDNPTATELAERMRRILTDPPAPAQATGSASCCAKTVQASCCAPEEKAGCCGTEAAVGASCGCS